MTNHLAVMRAIAGRVVDSDTRDQAAASMNTAANAARKLGASVAEINDCLLALVNEWPVAVRPTPEEIGSCAMFQANDLTQPDAKEGSQNDAAGDLAASEAAVAQWLASTNLKDRLRWSASTNGGGWHEWDGIRWKLSADRAPLRLQSAVRRALATGIESRVFEAKVSTRLETAGAIRGIGSLLAAFPSMALADDVNPPGIIAFPRGVLDLITGEWMPHDPARPITRACPVDPGSMVEGWALIEFHLSSCLGDSFPAVHRLLGSSLLGRGADRRVLWLTGPGNDGKSTLAKVLRLALGEHAAVVPAETFEVGGSRGANGHELAASLAGSRLAIALEVSPRLDWQRLKSLSGGDEQRTKRLHGRGFSYDRPPVLLLISNEQPNPPDRAAAERLIVAKLSPPDDPDERLMTALKTPGPERDAIAAACLSWLITGCREFLEHGLGPVPLAGFIPTGLSAWWAAGVADGRLITHGREWSTLEALRTDMEANGVQDIPRNNDLAAFMKSVVEFKRNERGRFYRVGIKAAMTPHDASLQSSPHVYRETDFRRHEASFL